MDNIHKVLDTYPKCSCCLREDLSVTMTRGVREAPKLPGEPPSLLPMPDILYTIKCLHCNFEMGAVLDSVTKACNVIYKTL